MVILRTYWSPAEAALAKSVLDNYEISCALLDEHSSVYSRGGQFAVPIRLAVDERDIDRAICVLNGDLDKAIDLGAPDTPNERPTEAFVADEKANRHPWELLVLAFYLLVPAICLILTKFPTHVAGRYARYYVARATITRFLGWLAVIAAVLLIGSYFAVRRSVQKQRPSAQDPA